MINIKKNTAFIFARGNSKGLVKKNIKLFNGKPLISYAIEIALESKLYDHVIVSTDSEEIAEISEAFGAEIPFMRPKELALDDSPELLSWKHAINSFEQKFGYKLKSFSSIPCTSPLRTVKDIKEMVKMYNKKKYDLVVGINVSNHSPQFNMVHKDSNNLISIINPKKKITRRQDTRDCYNINTVGYIASPKYIMNTDDIFKGRIGGYIIPKNRSIDIDDSFDFKIAEYLYESPKR